MTKVTPVSEESKRVASELYARFMADIEPDLLDENILTLDEKYKGETEQEHAARIQRYEEAYAEFDRRVDEFLTELSHIVQNAKMQAFREVEAAEKETEAGKLAQLENTFST